MKLLFTVSLLLIKLWHPAKVPDKLPCTSFGFEWRIDADTDCNSLSSLPHKTGDVIDQLDGVAVHYNGNISNVHGRNLTPDGYNLGLKFQCVEFVKRYYYEIYKHKMPDSYGHAKDFFNPLVKDGQVNKERGLFQFTNGSFSKPQKGDIVIFQATPNNAYGHTGIVSKVQGRYCEIIQQNVGIHSRASYRITYNKGHYYLSDKSIVCWLRKELL